MHYLKEFDGRGVLESPQPNIQLGGLKNPYTGQSFCDSWVNTYNRYTQDFNKATDRATQEFYLDQRHKFFSQCIGLVALT